MYLLLRYVLPPRWFSINCHRKYRDLIGVGIVMALLLMVAAPVYKKITTRAIVTASMADSLPVIQKILLQKALSGFCPGNSFNNIPLKNSIFFQNYHVNDHSTLDGPGCAVSLDFQPGLDTQLDNKGLMLIYVQHKHTGKISLSSCFSDIDENLLPQQCVHHAIKDTTMSVHKLKI